MDRQNSHRKVLHTSPSETGWAQGSNPRDEMTEITTYRARPPEEVSDERAAPTWEPSPSSRRSPPPRPSRAATARGRPVPTARSSSAGTADRHLPPGERPSPQPPSSNAHCRCSYPSQIGYGPTCSSASTLPSRRWRVSAALAPSIASTCRFLLLNFGENVVCHRQSKYSCRSWLPGTPANFSCRRRSRSIAVGPHR